MSMVGGVCPRFACSFTSVSSVAGNYKYTEIKTDKYANKEWYIYRKLLMQIGNNSVIPYTHSLTLTITLTLILIPNSNP